MHIESPNWDAWENQFTALAEQAQRVDTHDVAQSAKVNGAQHYLCLYGDNGLSEEGELSELAAMAARVHEVKKLEVDTVYWQETVLFIPAP